MTQVGCVLPSPPESCTPVLPLFASIAGWLSCSLGFLGRHSTQEAEICGLGRHGMVAA